MVRKLTAKKVEHLYKTNYRYIDNVHSTTKFNVNIVDNSNVSCECIVGIFIDPNKTVATNCGKNVKLQYRKSNVDIIASTQHDLPLVVDGMINLYSKIQRKIYKTSVYKATWIVHTNSGASTAHKYGYIGKLNTKNGVIYYHADTIQQAFHGVNSKEAGTNAEHRKKSNFKDKIPEDLTISYQDSIDAGNCPSGTTNFVHQFKLKQNKDYNARKIFMLAPRNNNLKRVINYAMKHT